MPKDKNDKDGEKKETVAAPTDLNAGGNQADTAQASSTTGAQAQDVPLPVLVCNIGPSSSDGAAGAVPDHFTESVKNVITQVQEEITVMISDIEAKTTAIVNEIDNSIQELEQLQRSAVSGMINEYTAYLDQVEVKGRNTQRCINEHRSQIDQIKINAKTLADQCIAEAHVKRLAVPNQIQGHKAKIQDNLKVLETTFQECRASSENFCQLAKCVGVRATIIQTEVFGIMKEIGGAFMECSKQGYSIVAETQGCLGKVVNEVNSQIHNLTDSINRCMATSTSTDPV